jgi:polyhydroxyalkanoate synthesis regulator phasin
MFLTKEKVEEAVRKLVAEKKLSREAAQQLTHDLIETGERQWKELEGRMTESLRKGVRTLDIASRGELEELKAKVDDLEKRIAMLETPGQTTGEK